MSSEHSQQHDIFVQILRTLIGLAQFAMSWLRIPTRQSFSHSGKTFSCKIFFREITFTAQSCLERRHRLQRVGVDAVEGVQVQRTDVAYVGLAVAPVKEFLYS